jgi:hypothetical protein
MSTRPPSVRHIAGANLVIIGATSLLDNYFAAASLVPETLAPSQTVIEEVASHTRRRYPGHVGYGVTAHARVTTTEVGRNGGGASPGERFWCERPTGSGALRKANAVQFSYIGSWKDLKAFARANITGASFVLRNKTGRSVVIAS